MSSEGEGRGKRALAIGTQLLAFQKDHDKDIIPEMKNKSFVKWYDSEWQIYVN